MGAERLTARNFYHGKPVVMPNFPGNFRKGKMPQNALFPKEFPETLVQANPGGSQVSFSGKLLGFGPLFFAILPRKKSVYTLTGRR